jgi:hypothetical protein
MSNPGPNIAMADALFCGVFGMRRIGEPTPVDDWPSRDQIRECLRTSTISQWWDMPLWCEPCGPAPCTAADAAQLITPGEERKHNGRLRHWLAGSIGVVRLGEEEKQP